MKTAFFAGSFNPFTKGHADILNRLLRIADKVIVGIGMNIEKPSSSKLAESSALNIREYLRRNNLESKVEVVTYTGLTAQEALELKADFLARGVRSGADFEYEYSLAAANRDAFGIETILIPADPRLGFVSSTMIRDLKLHGCDDIADKYLP